MKTNTITIVLQSVVIDGDNDMQFMGLMQKHITRKPATTSKALE